MYRVKVGDHLFSEASAPSKKAARQLAAEEAVKELMADGRLHLNRVRSSVSQVVLLREPALGLGMTSEIQQTTQTGRKRIIRFCFLNTVRICVFVLFPHFCLL